MLATDEEIATAVAAWIDARGETAQSRWPVEIVALFRYADGFGGSVRWETERQHVEWDTDRTIGPWFVYFLCTDCQWAELRFTPEFFREFRADTIATMHREAQCALERVAAA